MVGDVHVVPARRRDRRGDAEVGDDRLAFLEQDVFRLDVPVDDAEAVGVAERGGDRPGDPERDVHRELAFANEPVAEGLAAGVGHDEVQEPRAAGPLGLDLAGIVQRKDLRVGEPRRDADLAEEPLGLVARHRAEHLDGHLAAVLQVLGQIDGGRTSPPDLVLEPVALGDDAVARGG